MVQIPVFFSHIYFVGIFREVCKKKKKRRNTFKLIPRSYPQCHIAAQDNQNEKRLPPSYQNVAEVCMDGWMEHPIIHACVFYWELCWSDFNLKYSDF